MEQKAVRAWIGVQLKDCPMELVASSTGPSWSAVYISVDAPVSKGRSTPVFEPNPKSF